MSHMNPYVERAFHDELEKIAVSWYTKLLATGKAGKQALDMGLGAAGRAARMDWQGANSMLRGAARRGNQALGSGSSLLGSMRQAVTQKAPQPSRALGTIQDQLKKMRSDASSAKNLAGAAVSERNAALAKGRDTLQGAVNTVRANMPSAQAAVPVSRPPVPVAAPARAVNPQVLMQQQALRQQAAQQSMRRKL